jgi:5-methylcytosine-specific restriction endonuclease McrA
MPSSDQARAQRRALRWAQNSICAGCGLHLPSARRLKRFDRDYPTFDHVVPKSRGGGRTLANGLLKHLRCNQDRGDRPASGCDRVWLEAVKARLSNRPRSFKPIFKKPKRKKV